MGPFGEFSEVRGPQLLRYTQISGDRPQRALARDLGAAHVRQDLRCFVARQRSPREYLPTSRLPQPILYRLPRRGREKAPAVAQAEARCPPVPVNSWLHASWRGSSGGRACTGRHHASKWPLGGGARAMRCGGGSRLGASESGRCASPKIAVGSDCSGDSASFAPSSSSKCASASGGGAGSSSRGSSRRCVAASDHPLCCAPTRGCAQAVAPSESGGAILSRVEARRRRRRAVSRALTALQRAYRQHRVRCCSAPRMAHETHCRTALGYVGPVSACVHPLACRADTCLSRCRRAHCASSSRGATRCSQNSTSSWWRACKSGGLVCGGGTVLCEPHPTARHGRNGTRATVALCVHAYPRRARRIIRATDVASWNRTAGIGGREGCACHQCHVSSPGAGRRAST